MEAASLSCAAVPASIAPTAASVVGARLTFRTWERRDRRAAARWPRDTNPFLRVWSVQNASTGPRESWGIHHNDEGQLIGRLSLRDIHSNTARLGIYLAPGWTGQGYGREALRLMLEHCFVGLGLERLALDVAASNQWALKCYLGIGFEYQYSEWRLVGPDPALALLVEPEYQHLRAFFDADYCWPTCRALFYELALRALDWTKEMRS